LILAGMMHAARGHLLHHTSDSGHVPLALSQRRRIFFGTTALTGVMALPHTLGVTTTLLNPGAAHDRLEKGRWTGPLGGRGPQLRIPDARRADAACGCIRYHFLRRHEPRDQASEGVISARGARTALVLVGECARPGTPMTGQPSKIFKGLQRPFRAAAQPTPRWSSVLLQTRNNAPGRFCPGRPMPRAACAGSSRGTPVERGFPRRPPRYGARQQFGGSAHLRAPKSLRINLPVAQPGRRGCWQQRTNHSPSRGEGIAQQGPRPARPARNWPGHWPASAAPFGVLILSGGP